MTYVKPQGNPDDHIKIFKDDLIPVDQRDGWYRDPDSQAIVNCNVTQYEEYMASYTKRRRKEDELASATHAVSSLQNDVDALKSDISDMKSLLLKLVEKDDAS